MQPGALLALASALAFGLCDFFAGAGSRRMDFWWVTLTSLATSVAGAWTVTLLSGDPATPRAVLWGTIAGIGAATGSTALYRGYGRGQMAVAGPVSAVGAAALPAVVGAVLGERLPGPGLVGVVAAMPAIWLMSSTGAVVADVRLGAVDGLLSGAGFAVEFVGLERAGDAAGLWPVAVSQSTALLLVSAVVLVGRRGARLARAPLALAALAGALSLAATGLYFLAANTGMLVVAAVLTSLYPAVTVLLAAVVLHERPDRRQLVGLVLGGIAVALIAIG